MPPGLKLSELPQQRRVEPRCKPLRRERRPLIGRKMIQGTGGGLVGARPPVAKSELVDAHRRKPLNTGQMLTDKPDGRELELVHNFACPSPRIPRSGRRRLRKSVIVSQLGFRSPASGSVTA